MRVLHVISSSGLYGAEAVILTLMREMQRMGQPHALGVFDNPAGQKHALHEKALERGLESHLLPCKGQADFATTSAIRGLAASTKADIIHAHGYKADLYTLLALRKSPLTLVSTCHLWTDADLAIKLYGMLDRFCLRYYKGVAAVSSEIRDRAIASGIDEAKVTLIHNGIDWEPFAQRKQALLQSKIIDPEKVLTVGFASRLAREKGIDFLLQTIATVVEEIPKVHFKIAGDGPERPLLEQELTAQKLSGNVTLLGRYEDMPGFFSSIDILFSSSRAEGLPMALMEAMACATPVVATAVGDVPQIIRDGETGLLVAPGDVSAMAAAITRFLKNREFRERLGSKAQTLVKMEFSAARMAEGYLKFYREALAR